MLPIFIWTFAGQDRYVGVLKIELNGIIFYLSIMNIISVDLLRMMGSKSESQKSLRFFSKQC